jgi:hypothetical protein
VRRAQKISGCWPFALLLITASVTGCGKSGPPLPPLVRLPAAPIDLSATRHGDSVDVDFMVPSANTDGSRPANLTRVDIYAYTGPPNLTDDEVARLATRVGSVDVKAPRDPNATVDPDEPLSDVAAPEGSGLDQGAPGSMSETLTSAAIKTVERPAPSDARAESAPVHPLAAAPLDPPTRFYAGVGITTRGRRGPFSRRAGVPLIDPPPPVAAPDVTYDESTITVTWPASAPSVPEDAANPSLLPSRLLGPPPPSFAYNVYEVKPSEPGTGAASEMSRLTKDPVDAGRFEDTRIEWGVERCYAVRMVRTVNALTVESEASPQVCRTLKDTFPPKPPSGVQHIPSAGAVNLTWDQNSEKDLAGYLVLRGTDPSGALEPVTPSPIPNSSYTDSVTPGAHFVYAIQAVDRAGNVSKESQRIEETAR